MRGRRLNRLTNEPFFNACLYYYILQKNASDFYIKTSKAANHSMLTAQKSELIASLTHIKGKISLCRLHFILQNWNLLLHLPTCKAKSASAVCTLFSKTGIYCCIYPRVRQNQFLLSASQSPIRYKKTCKAYKYWTCRFKVFTQYQFLVVRLSVRKHTFRFSFSV